MRCDLDRDFDEVRSFFLPGAQFDGSTSWQFGKGLRGSFLDTLEAAEKYSSAFLWRDDSGAVVSVSCVCLSSGLVSLQVLPGWRNSNVVFEVVEYSLGVLRDFASDVQGRFYCYESDMILKSVLGDFGYVEGPVVGVNSLVSLDGPLKEMEHISGFAVTILNMDNEFELHRRARLQAEIYGDASEAALQWQLRNQRRVLDYNGENIIELGLWRGPKELVGFATIMMDRESRIAEMRPLAVSRGVDDKMRCINILAESCLVEMQRRGMRLGVAKLEIEDMKFICEHSVDESVLRDLGRAIGLEVRDRLFCYRQDPGC